jgi:hypothetical protein
VVEVLSPSTRYIEASAKLAGYFRLPSVQHYLIVDPDRPTVMHHTPADRTIPEKRTSGLPKGSHPHHADGLNANRQSDSFTSPEIAPRKFQPLCGRYPDSGAEADIVRGAHCAPANVDYPLAS